MNNIFKHSVTVRLEGQDYECQGEYDHILNVFQIGKVWSNGIDLTTDDMIITLSEDASIQYSSNKADDYYEDKMERQRLER